VYASIVFFNGNSLSAGVVEQAPYNVANNVNQIDGDTDGDGAGAELQTLGSPAIVALQDAYYVRRSSPV
ncbi:MAG: hypothetical protein IPK16_26890, partial [Anaerolineales bacterium]|nr:hypothetical protein [Anaerolineales bacterium]